jgi:hypothetical protein
VISVKKRIKIIQVHVASLHIPPDHHSLFYLPSNLPPTFFSHHFSVSAIIVSITADVFTGTVKKGKCGVSETV